MDERERGLQPLADEATGCTLLFVAYGRGYQPLAALAVLAALYARKFSGACEYYLRPGVRDGEHLVGVGLGFEGEAPGESWWSTFVSDVQAACADDEDIRLARSHCAFASVGELRAALLHAGSVGFEAGTAAWVSDPAGFDPNSPFTVTARRVRYDGT